MSFMEIETYHGHVQRINNTRDGDIITPEQYAQYPSNEDAAEAYGVSVDEVVTEFGWYARLSAPGYLDCTDWTGPYESEDEAINELRDMYDIDDENN